MLALATATAAPADPEPSARFLIFALDAVPFQTAAALTQATDGGPDLLRSLEGPVPLVSSFPSSTNVALTAILDRWGLEPPPGYENKFFDRQAGKVRGGTLGSYGKIRFDWHYFFDWQLRGFFSKSIAYARPLVYNVKEVKKALKAFEASDQRAFFVYVNSTDATGHSHGPEALGHTFEHLHDEIEALRSRLDVPLYVVLFSDHGMGGGEKLRNGYPQVNQALKAAGWRIRKRLGREHSIVLTPFGLVSNFEVYTPPGDEASVVEVLVAEPGVDLCAYREQGRWIVANQDGRAIIESRPDGAARTWSYRPDGADPLEYADVLARLKKGYGDVEFFDETSWFRETADESYPDALFRLATGFELVQNPASILCSVATGYLYGSKSATFSARLSVGQLQWTHGALARDATLGFLMTDYPGWQATGAVRFDRALDFLADHLIEEKRE